MSPRATGCSARGRRRRAKLDSTFRTSARASRSSSPRAEAKASSTGAAPASSTRTACRRPKLTSVRRLSEGSVVVSTISSSLNLAMHSDTYPWGSPMRATMSFTEQPGWANTSLKTKARPAGMPGRRLPRMASSPILVRRRPKSTRSMASISLTIHRGSCIVNDMFFSTRRRRHAPAPRGLLLACSAAALLAASLAQPSTATPTAQPSVAGAASGALTNEAVPLPEVTGPVTSPGEPYLADEALLKNAGYVEDEYFVRGRATNYAEAGDWGSDGRWAVKVAGHAAYETRVLVRRPAKAVAFNGTVVVEWDDAPNGRDSDPEFLWESAELLRAGFAWVGVTTDGNINASVPPSGKGSISFLKELEPARYHSLVDPGVDFAYSMYSQVAEALLHPRGADLLGASTPKRS